MLLLLSLINSVLTLSLSPTSSLPLTSSSSQSTVAVALVKRLETGDTVGGYCQLSISVTSDLFRYL